MVQVKSSVVKKFFLIILEGRAAAEPPHGEGLLHAGIVPKLYAAGTGLGPIDSFQP